MHLAIGNADHVTLVTVRQHALAVAELIRHVVAPAELLSRPGKTCEESGRAALIANRISVGQDKNNRPLIAD